MVFCVIRYPGLKKMRMQSNVNRGWCPRYQRFPERTPYYECDSADLLSAAKVYYYGILISRNITPVRRLSVMPESHTLHFPS